MSSRNQNVEGLLSWEERRSWSAAEVQTWMNSSGFSEYSSKVVEEDIDGAFMFGADVGLLKMVGFKIGPAKKCLDMWQQVPGDLVAMTSSIPDTVSTISTSYGSSSASIDGQHHVYILLKRGALGSVINSCPETFTASSNETFGSLLQRFIDSRPEKKEDYDRLLTLPTTVYCYQSAECNTQNRVKALLSDSCGTLSNHQLRFICFVFHGQQLCSTKASGSETLKMLMRAQNRQTVPERYVSTNGKALSFDLELFNCIVQCYEDGGLSVHTERREQLKKLTLTLRNALQHIHGKVSQSKLPKRFQFRIERQRDRVDLSRDKLECLATELANCMGEASCFLASKRWSDFKNDLDALHGLLTATANSMKTHAESMQAHRKKNSKRHCITYSCSTNH